jgi:phosphate transport system protein
MTKKAHPVKPLRVLILMDKALVPPDDVADLTPGKIAPFKTELDVYTHLKSLGHDVMKLALRGPMARDLREILSAIRIAADIERIGDYAANVAKRSTALNLSPPLPHISGLHAIGTLAVQQLRDVLAAYRDNNIELAQRVRARDAEIDIAYTALFRELLTYMMEDARSITACTHLLFMAKNIERIGDHATNIAENVWFLIHGEGLLPPREKRDETNTATP